MGVLKDRLQTHIAALESELIRLDQDNARFKAGIQARLDTLKRADQALTPEIEALVGELQAAGVDIFR